MFSNLRSLIFKLDPETAHSLAIKSLKLNFIPNILMAYLMGKLIEYSMLDFESKFFDSVSDEVSAIVHL